jgi:hypothetical protein
MSAHQRAKSARTRTSRQTTTKQIQWQRVRMLQAEQRAQQWQSQNTACGARTLHLHDNAVAVLQQHDVHQLRSEECREWACEDRQKPLADVQHAGNAVLLQVACQLGVMPRKQPLKLCHFMLEPFLDMRVLNSWKARCSGMYIRRMPARNPMPWQYPTGISVKLYALSRLKSSS